MFFVYFIIYAVTLHLCFLHVMLHQDLIYENNFNKDNNLALLKEYWLFNTKKVAFAIETQRRNTFLKCTSCYEVRWKGLWRASHDVRGVDSQGLSSGKPNRSTAMLCEGPSDRKLFFQHVRQLGISLRQHGQQLLKLQRGGGGDVHHKHTNYCLT